MTRRDRFGRSPLLLFFAIIFGITWSLGAVSVLARDWVDTHLGPITATHPAFVAAVYAPSLTAIALTALIEGPSGLKALLGRLVPWRVRWHWSALIILALPVSAAAVTRLAGVALAPAPTIGGFLTVAIPALLLDPGPLGEELGWRGFALPRLLERRPPLTASLMLGTIWGVWHLPGFLEPGIIQSTLPVPVFLLGILAMSVLSTWLFVNAGGSVVPSILLHWMGNSFRLLGVPFEVGVGVAAAWAVVIVGAGQLRSRTGQRDGRLPPAP
jgi:membrane protease YdiL (CAAX protease family)